MRSKTQKVQKYECTVKKENKKDNETKSQKRETQKSKRQKDKKRIKPGPGIEPGLAEPHSTVLPLY